MMRSNQTDDLQNTIDTLTNDEIFLANKIYELSEKLEKALFIKNDAFSYLQMRNIKRLDENIKKTLSDTVQKEFLALNRLENILSQRNMRKNNPDAKRGFDSGT
ncbi:MAG TPA: hypothetical protein PKV51_09480 [Bacillota bacterium]|nr:hypothetical protein [Bacillota bacterium]HPP86140.1 hypothetical protein [Bacillota bacterium]